MEKYSEIYEKMIYELDFIKWMSESLRKEESWESLIELIENIKNHSDLAIKLIKEIELL